MEFLLHPLPYQSSKPGVILDIPPPLLVHSVLCPVAYASHIHLNLVASCHEHHLDLNDHISLLN